MIFDTLAFAKRFKEVGFTEAQAEELSEALRVVMVENLATKQDVADVRQDIKDLEGTLRQDISEVRQEISEVRQEIKDTRKDLEVLGTRLTLRLGGLIVAGVGILAVLMKVL